MCRTGGRRCPSHSDPQKIAARNARRRAAYQERKNNSPHESNVLTAENPQLSTPLSAQQEKYFHNSKVASNGSLIAVHHGAATEFSSFDPTMLGRGNDTWGNGFYFTDQRSMAEAYATESDSAEANVKDFYLNLENPIYVDGKENTSLENVSFPAETVANILKQHPTAYLQPNEDDGEMNFLGDYSDKYWNKDHYTKEELDEMIDEVAHKNFAHASWIELETTFGRENGAAFLAAVHKETGYDGVIVDFGEDGKNYVAWFPQQMKLTSNVEPQEDDKF